MSNILIIEDEVKIARFLQLELLHEGYEVLVENDGRSGLETALKGNIDIIILDIMLPSLTGTEVCRRIRQVSEVPIIMLTAKDDISDKVMGLNMGADDYITKPFAIEELLARIRVVLKRKNGEKDDSKNQLVNFKGLTLDLNKRSADYNGEEIILTKTEFDLLLYLIENKNKVVKREEILNKIWGYDYMGYTNNVDVYIRYIRTKIDDKYDVKLIHTVRGIGYIVKDND